MPIRLPHGLPARRVLESEGIEVFSGNWSPRPLRIALVNLMPQKRVTEAQLARLLGGTLFPVDLTLVVPDGYRPKTTPGPHLSAFYQPWSRVRALAFDGLVVTGAPVETLPFEAVTYWDVLADIFDWAEDAVARSLYICWAAQAALYHYHGVPKHTLSDKAFGVFPHRVRASDATLLRGFDEGFPVPVSRHTEVRAVDLPREAGLAVLAESEEAGLCLIEEPARGADYMFNHLEYDTGTLAQEYARDRAASRPVGLPRNYFPGNDPAKAPVNGWRFYGQLFFRNWLSEIQRARLGAEHADPVREAEIPRPGIWMQPRRLSMAPDAVTRDGWG
jgi:homoserine O-succinyltransferase